MDSKKQVNRDPWRLVCPECERRTGKIRRRVQVGPNEWMDEDPYHCDNCNSDIPGLFDLKDDVVRRPDGTPMLGE